MASPLDGLKHATPEKHSKAMVVYMGREQGPFKCAHCEYFTKPSGCQIVEGYIDPEGCCNLYESVEEGGPYEEESET